MTSACLGWRKLTLVNNCSVWYVVVFHNLSSVLSAGTARHTVRELELACRVSSGRLWKAETPTLMQLGTIARVEGLLKLTRNCLSWCSWRRTAQVGAADARWRRDPRQASMPRRARGDSEDGPICLQMLRRAHVCRNFGLDRPVLHAMPLPVNCVQLLGLSRRDASTWRGESECWQLAVDGYLAAGQRHRAHHTWMRGPPSADAVGHDRPCWRAP